MLDLGRAHEEGEASREGRDDGAHEGEGAGGVVFEADGLEADEHARRERERPERDESERGRVILREGDDGGDDQRGHGAGDHRHPQAFRYRGGPHLHRHRSLLTMFAPHDLRPVYPVGWCAVPGSTLPSPCCNLAFAREVNVE
ncbi:hypothetical protein ACFPRL_16815 [Pseudoclavibacter helvolus]